MRRWPPGWPRRFRTLMSSWRVTAWLLWSGWPRSSREAARRRSPAAGRWPGDGRGTMREIRERLQTWSAASTPFALATVVGVRGSAPRDPGAAMAVAADGEVVGSVSGGCVEGAVYETAREVLESGHATLETYGISDEDAFAVGLTCGGTLDVLVQPVGPDAAGTAETAVPAATAISEVLAAIGVGEPVATATVVAAPPDARVEIG